MRFNYSPITAGITAGILLLCLGLSTCQSTTSQTNVSTTQGTLLQGSPNQNHNNALSQVVTKSKLTFRLSEERTFFPDGELVSEIITTYDQLARPLLVENRNGKGQVLRTKTYLYDKDTADFATQTATGSVIAKGRLILDQHGHVLEETLLNANGQLQSKSTYSYDSQGNELRWVVIDGSGIVLSITEYQYQNGLVVESQVKDAGSKLVKRFLYSYDSQSRLVEKKELDDKGLLSLIISQSYDNLTLSREERNGSGVLLRKRLIDLDRAGNEMKSILYDARGRVLEINQKVWRGLELADK